ncbi:MAG: acetyltransferase [Hamadaea sp.]|nr:acetyltransferase [Hamadaea sp.]
MSTVFETTVDGFGRVGFAPVDPAADAELLHSWVTEDRARFWGMLDAGRADVQEIYERLDTLSTHHAYLVRRDGTPVALIQTYEPEADRVGECYPVAPGDLGLHLFLGPAADGAVPGFSAALVSAVLRFLFDGLGARRLVADPDAANVKAIARLVRSGFTLGPLVTLPEVRLPEVFLPAKQAQLAFRTRP